MPGSKRSEPSDAKRLVRIETRLPHDIAEALRARAEENGRSVIQELRVMVTQQLKAAA